MNLQGRIVGPIHESQSRPRSDQEQSDSPGGHSSGQNAGRDHTISNAFSPACTSISRRAPNPSDPVVAALSGAASAGALGRMTVQKADGASVHEATPLSAALQAAGFAATPRGLRLRG